MQTIERAFAVLRAIAHADERAGVSDVAATTGLPKSTVSRILSSLEDIGVLERLDPGARYSIGPGMATLVANVSRAGMLREVAHPYLRDLVAEFGESAGLSITEGDVALYVDHVPATGAVQTRDWTGMRFPLHTVAGGFAVMALWPDQQIDGYAAAGLDTFTSSTVTTRSALRSRIGRVRRDGYAWTMAEFSDDINGVAAAIVDDGGQAIGALNVYGPAFRFPGGNDPAVLGERIAEVAHQVSQRMRSR